MSEANASGRVNTPEHWEYVKVNGKSFGAGTDRDGASTNCFTDTHKWQRIISHMEFTTLNPNSNPYNPLWFSDLMHRQLDAALWNSIICIKSQQQSLAVSHTLEVLPWPTLGVQGKNAPMLWVWTRRADFPTYADLLNLMHKKWYKIN